MSSSLTNPNHSSADVLSERWIDLRLVSATRLMLATSALVVVLIEPLDSSRYLALTYTAFLYTLYSAVFCVLAIKRSRLVPMGIMHWLDMAWYLALVALSSGANSMFFNYFFFAILVASLDRKSTR